MPLRMHVRLSALLAMWLLIHVMMLTQLSARPPFAALASVRPEASVQSAAVPLIQLV